MRNLGYFPSLPIKNQKIDIKKKHENISTMGNLFKNDKIFFKRRMGIRMK